MLPSFFHLNDGRGTDFENYVYKYNSGRINIRGFLKYNTGAKQSKSQRFTTAANVRIVFIEWTTTARGSTTALVTSISSHSCSFYSMLDRWLYLELSFGTVKLGLGN